MLCRELTNGIYSEYPVKYTHYITLQFLVTTGYTDIIYCIINKSIEIISSSRLFSHREMAPCCKCSWWVSLRVL